MKNFSKLKVIKSQLQVSMEQKGFNKHVHLRITTQVGVGVGMGEVHSLLNLPHRKYKK